MQVTWHFGRYWGGNLAFGVLGMSFAVQGWLEGLDQKISVDFDRIDD